jgi:hypothetical protein
MTQATAEFVAAAAWRLAGSNRVWRAIFHHLEQDSEPCAALAL